MIAEAIVRRGLYKYKGRFYFVPWFSVCFVFFFSSRRRHTRFDCDWSSDVCSSDLVGVVHLDWGPLEVDDSDMGDGQIVTWANERLARKHDKPIFLGVGFYRPHIPLRSEERRVGKECRSWVATFNERKSTEKIKPYE